MDFISFLTSLGTSFVLFLVLMLLFAWLSSKPGNSVVYYPNRILKGLDPCEGGSSTTRNPFSWIREALSSTEQDVISISGVDTAVYFVFLSTALGILALSGVILLPLLLPIAATDNSVKLTDNSTSNGTFNELNKLAMGNVQAKSWRLWAFLIATYWISFVVYLLLWKGYKRASSLRAEALMSPEVKVEQFAVLVRDIPPPAEGQNRKEHVDTFFQAIYPNTFYRSLIVTNNKEVNKLYEELEGYKRKLERAEVILEESKKEGKLEGTRPMHRTGFLGLIGKKVDSIEFYNERINQLIPELVNEQKITLREKQQDAALIFFTDRVVAASAAQSLHAQIVNKWTVIDSPEPRQIVWTNLKIKFFARQLRQYIVYFIVALTIFFYMIPIGFISAVTTLDNLVKLLPFIRPIVKIAALKTVLEAYLPQVALIIFLALLPQLLLFLSKAEGIPSEGHAIRAASGKFFYFSVLNVFIGITLSGTLFNTFKSIEKNPNSVIDILATSLPGSATYFLTFVALKFFVGYGLELSRIIPLIIYHLKRKYLCKTERELKEAWFPGDLSYGTRGPSDMLVLTIVLCYSVIAPLIIPFGFIYFSLGWLVLRNQALKVYVPAYETNGRMWPHLHTRILAALLLFQVTMFGFFGVKKFVYAVLLVPLPIISLLFGYVCYKKFYRAFCSTPLEVAGQKLKETPNMDSIFRSYIPPSLSCHKVDDDEPGDALYQVSTMDSIV